jgi:divalent metal cation (Fe/Co/Zn/Cd) transporter
MLGLMLATAGIFLYQITGNPVFDGLASISIGVVLVLTAILLAMESKSLLIGESADPRIAAKIRELLNADERILEINEVATLHMGPDFIVAAVSVDFIDGMPAEQLEASVTDNNGRIKAIDPRIRRVFIEAERREDHRPQST